MYTVATPDNILIIRAKINATKDPVVPSFMLFIMESGTTYTNKLIIKPTKKIKQNIIQIITIAIFFIFSYFIASSYFFLSSYYLTIFSSFTPITSYASYYYFSVLSFRM